MSEAGFRLRMCSFHCFFVILYILFVLCIDYQYFPSSDRFPLVVLFISCLLAASLSGLWYMVALYADIDVFCSRGDIQAMGLFAEGECYGATFHPGS